MLKKKNKKLRDVLQEMFFIKPSIIILEKELRIILINIAILKQN